MKRDELISRTRQLIDEGERLLADPSLVSLQVWLQRSDDLLSVAWGSMDRYHLSWLNVGRGTTVRGRELTAEEEAAYVRDIASQKTAVLRMSLDAADRQRMPFVGEDREDRPGGPGTDAAAGERADRPAPPPRRGPSDPDLARRLEEARTEAERHRDHDAPRAPRPERMQR